MTDGVETTLAALLERTATDLPDRVTASVAFATRQGASHAGRTGGYRNEVLSIRVGEAVGSCAVEPGGTMVAVEELVGSSARELLAHPDLPVRVATLDAVLQDRLPHSRAPGATAVTLPGGTSLGKSMARARAVVSLLGDGPSRTVAVVGVVNSLLAALRERRHTYVPCDLKGGVTEWGDAVITDAHAALGACEVLMVTGMTLGNGTFAPLVEEAARRDVPVVVFAQTASAVFPHFLGSWVSGVSAEPYPFFWLTGEPTTIHLYGGWSS